MTARSVRLRTASPADVTAMYDLIAANAAAGHLLPRTLDEVREHAANFVVAVLGRRVVGCAELAPVSQRLVEVRSLAVAAAARHRKIGTMLMGEMRRRAEKAGYQELCVMTHAPEYFGRLGFSVVPHSSVPEKVARDCVSCSKYRVCGQAAMVVPLTLPLRRQDNGVGAPFTIALQVA